MGIEAANRRARRHEFRGLELDRRQPRRRKPKTGTPKHVESWKEGRVSWERQKAIKKQLEKMTLGHLAERVQKDDKKLAEALWKMSAGVKNMWELTQVSRRYLGSIRDVGPMKIAAVEQYLQAYGISTKWDSKS